MTLKVWEQRTPVKVRTFFESELKKMAEDKNLGEISKKHWRHKPYKCDFGGGKNEDK